jgi:hypothetical protein
MIGGRSVLGHGRFESDLGLDSIFLDAVNESGSGDPEQLGGFGFIPLFYPESLKDIFLLNFI